MVAELFIFIADWFQLYGDRFVNLSVTVSDEAMIDRCFVADQLQSGFQACTVYSAMGSHYVTAPFLTQVFTAFTSTILLFIV